MKNNLKKNKNYEKMNFHKKLIIRRIKLFHKFSLKNSFFENYYKINKRK